MKLFKKAKKGFTLVELVVVIAVIAILSAVSVGAYFGITDTANRSAAEQGAKQLHTAVMALANDPSVDGFDITADGKIDTYLAVGDLETAFETFTTLDYTFVAAAPTAEADDNTVWMADGETTFVYVTNGKVATVTVITGAIDVA